VSQKPMTFIAQFPHPVGRTAYVFFDYKNRVATVVKQWDCICTNPLTRRRCRGGGGVGVCYRADGKHHITGLLLLIESSAGVVLQVWADAVDQRLVLA